MKVIYLVVKNRLKSKSKPETKRRLMKCKLEKIKCRYLIKRNIIDKLKESEIDKFDLLDQRKSK